MMLYVLIFPKRRLNLVPIEKTTNKTYYVYITYKLYIVYNVYINPSLLEAQHSKKISFFPLRGFLFYFFPHCVIKQLVS